MGYSYDERAKEIIVRVYIGFIVTVAELRLPVGLDSFEEKRLLHHFANVRNNAPFELSVLLPIPGDDESAQIFYLPCIQTTDSHGFSEYVTKVILQEFHTNTTPILIPMSSVDEATLMHFLSLLQ